MKRDIMLFIDDIIENINLIIDSTKKFSKEEFSGNKDIQDATIRRLEIIGEAVKNIPDSFKEKFQKIKWKEVAGTRDILIHSYFKVDVDKVWEVIKKDIPELKKQIQEILNEENK
jgi:uncharacterized protein with HEPN domain